MTDMSRVVLEPIFVLHTRPYSNTSLIVECFSMHCGRVAMMARSARGPKSRFKGKLQLFTPMLASWSGKFELKHLNQLELQGRPYQLMHRVLLCGFYLNELLMKLLRHDDPYPRLFEYYQQTLQQLEVGAGLEPVLRYFEKNLLNVLGYGLPLTHDAASGQSIISDVHYRYLTGRGFVKSDVSDSEDRALFSGAALTALSNESLSETAHLAEIKRLMRMVIAEHLDGKQLSTRELLT